MCNRVSRIALTLATALVPSCAEPRAPSADAGQPPSTRAESPAAASLHASPYYEAEPDMRVARLVAGCYALTMGAWSDPRANGGHIPNPPRVELDAQLRDQGQPGFQLIARTPGFTTERASHFPPAWSPVGADSLQVRAWADGFSSVTLFVRRQTDGTLAGTARYFTDVRLDDTAGRWMWERYPTAPATLRRAPCT